MEEGFDFSKIDEIVANHENSAVNIIAILQDIQEYYHYLPREIHSKEIGYKVIYNL